MKLKESTFTLSAFNGDLLIVDVNLNVFFRRAVCGAVLKSIVEKIEKKEKEEVRKVKKLELEEEKQKRLMVAKLHGTLYKHKEALKREILKKRSLMEKNLQQEIQVQTLLDIRLLIRACLYFWVSIYLV